MFAVMGITGNVGGAIAEALLGHGKAVRGIVRDRAKAQAWAAKGVELFAGGYDESLTAAFTGVEGVFAMIPPNLTPEPGFPESLAHIAALKRAVLAARPPRAVYLSSIGSEKTSGLGLITATHKLEQALGGSGIPSAFLRAGSFMQNLRYSIPAARATGQFFAFYQPLDHPFPLVAARDIGRIGAEILLETWHGDRFVEVAGPAYYTSNEVADALGQALGRPISAVAVPRETWADAMAQNGLPADRSGAYIEMLDSFNTGWIDFGVSGTEHAKGTDDLLTTVRSLAAETAKP